MKTRILAAALLIPLSIAEGMAQVPEDAVTQGRGAFQRAQSAYLQEDYQAYRKAMVEAVRLRPRQPTYLYNLAGAEALTGHPEEALKWLQRVAAMGMALPAAQDDDFTSLRGTAGFAKAVEQLKRNAQPVGKGRSLFRVHEKGLIPEGLARDPVSGDFFLGSVRQRKILRIDGRTFQVRNFSAPADALAGVFGMRVDPARGVLWACSSPIAEMEGFKKGESGGAGVFGYDLKSGKLIGRHLAPAGSGEHVFGDLAVDAQGTVYLSDSVSPGLWVLPAGQQELRPYLVPGPFSSPQGLDFSADGKALLVADYSSGIFSVELSTKRVSLLDSPENSTLLGIDGIYTRGAGIVAVQNGTQPNRVLSLTLSRSGKKIDRVAVLESATEALSAPTLGALDKSRFFVVSNSDWDAFDSAQSTMRPEKTQFPAILQLELPEGF
jgi:sugar lactone lactonase YvrE